MPEINLLQTNQSKSAFSGPSVSASNSFIVWVLAGLVVLELAGYGGLVWWKQSVEAETRDIEAATSEIDQSLQAQRGEITEAVQAQGRLQAFASLLDEHIYLTKLWKHLGEHTLKTAQYMTIQATLDKYTFVVSGEVANYTDLGKVILGLESADGFRSVELLSSGPGEGERVAVKFDIAVAIAPDILNDSGSQN